MIQIPAYLSRQVSLLEAAGKTGKTILVKKMQSESPDHIQIPVNILKNAGAKRVIACDRGTSFGYNDLIFDPRHIPIMKQYAEEVIVDVTHINKNYLPIKTRGMKLSKVTADASMAAGADGLFMEVHYKRELALCDDRTQLSISEFKEIIGFYNLKELMSEKNRRTI